MTAARLPAHIVPRPRLIDAMSVPARLVVVTGPAGSGKSVAVRAWVDAVGAPTAWLTLDARHGDPEAFLEALVGALEGLCPGVGEARRADGPADHAADRALERAAAHLREAGPAVLVLDDVHCVDRTPTAGLLARLVDLLAGTDLTLVLSSRSDPPVQLHRVRLVGEVVELREADLRFDVDEAVDLFARFPAVQLDRRQVERLVERTEGWAAGLHFAALSLAGRRDVDEFIERFAGSDRHVADFLLDEVLDRQPEEVRDFLLATSVLERMNADLCRRVTGRGDAGDLLRRVEAENLFVVPLDEDREWYRYHQLFRQLLRRELRMTRPDVERAGHERAAEWFAEHGEPGLAIDHHLDAGQLEAAFSLLRANLQHHLRTGRHQTVRHWIGRFPAAFVDADPARQLVCLWGLARAGSVAGASAVLERARSRPPGDVDPRAATLLDIAEVALAAVRGDPHTAVAVGEAVWARRDETPLSALPAELAAVARECWGYLPVGMARAHALLEDHVAARRWSFVVRRQGPRLPADLVSLLGTEAWMEARRGRLRVAAELADEGITLAAEHGAGARWAVIAARVARAMVHRERNELDDAVEVVEPHLATALEDGRLAMTTLGEVELAHVECARGCIDAALRRLLRTRRDLAAAGTPPFLAAVVDVAECRIRLRAGDLDRAVDLLETIEPGPERTLLEARARLESGRPGEVADLVAGLLEDDDDRLRRFEAVALAARAAGEQGDGREARHLLARVAGVARREGAVRRFLDEGFDIGEELAAAPTAPPAPVGARLVEPLSERELAVLRYLPSRLSNREIGAELYVSLNTVKSHLKAIYRKLDVDSRQDAVRRARQMGIL